MPLLLLLEAFTSPPEPSVTVSYGRDSMLSLDARSAIRAARLYRLVLIPRHALADTVVQTRSVSHSTAQHSNGQEAAWQPVVKCVVRCVEGPLGPSRRFDPGHARTYRRLLGIGGIRPSICHRQVFAPTAPSGIKERGGQPRLEHLPGAGCPHTW